MKIFVTLMLTFILFGCYISPENRKMICLGKGGEWIGTEPSENISVCKIQDIYYAVYVNGNMSNFKVE